MEERNLGRTGHLLPRLHRSATALLLSRNRYLGAFLVDQLSARGAQLVGDRPVPAGEPVTMILELPERNPVSIEGRALRQREMNGERVLAIAFEQLTAPAAKLVEEVAVEAPLPVDPRHSNRGSEASASLPSGYAR